ncbi:MAG TPA: hypothetical protein VN327_02315 [Pseudonocardiaceae bacterium]|nr:hypothetical protein [Pseudonocardiaceae bacterium]
MSSSTMLGTDLDTSDITRDATATTRQQEAPGQTGSAIGPTGCRHTAAHPRGRNPGDVWAIPTRPLREAHFTVPTFDPVPSRVIDRATGKVKPRMTTTR